MNGILLFDKPILWTSHDTVDFFRKKIGQPRVGHAGTLDPLATGLLVILLGSATKLSQKLGGLDKEYSGSLTLGMATDTQDLEGRVLGGGFLTAGFSVREEEVRRAFAGLKGVQEQRPPLYSAVKHRGRKLYELARSGVDLVSPARQITVHALELLRFREPDVDFILRCSKGTYVRTLCDTLGRRLGCGATLSSLVRTRVGVFDRRDALSEQALRRMSPEELEGKLIDEGV